MNTRAKIIKRLQIRLKCTMVLMLFIHMATAQDSGLNKYGLRVINNKKELVISFHQNKAKYMVNLGKTIPLIIFDLRYATVNNFTGKKLYPSINTTYLRKIVADSLALVQTELNKQGLGLKIFDAYRPYSITEKLWDMVKDERYAANPKNGSGHNRGIAVDLTIINLSNKQELDMGTGFDNFSDTAHHGFTNLPDSVLQNRLILKNIMEKHGFKALDTEWWHYHLPTAAKFELLDINFKQLKKLK